jgi:predicted RNA-binding Zn ribbon-like protein
MSVAEDRLRSKPLWETVRCPGGAVSLDFCNSGQGARNSTPVEWLASFADLVDWLETAAAIDGTPAARLRAAGERDPAAAEQVLRRALAFREALSRVLLAKTDARSADRADVAAIDAEYARAARFGRLAPTADGFAWHLDQKNEELDAVLWPLASSAVELLTSPKLARLRRCGSATCYWLFIDETKNCSRRWCEMASCGNRMKVRRHRARQGAASGAAAELDHPKAR